MIKKTILRVLNWLFSVNITPGDIIAISSLSKENIHLTELDLESIRVIAHHGLRITPKDVETIRLVLEDENQEHLNFIRFLNGDDAKLPAYQSERFIQDLKSLILLNRLDAIGDIVDGTQLSYSQEGESLILSRYFGFRADGFYVDVGAHHPKRFSNTHSFYMAGWRGVNIDPTPGVKEMFDEQRPGDLSFGVAVSNTEGMQNFYMFSEPALNTFSETLAEDYQRLGCQLLEVKPIETKRLSTVLEQCHIDKPIDFMSIDVEDHELPVLQSNDWNMFRPRVLLVEILNFDMKHPENFPVHNFILDLGYELFAKTCNTLFYKDGPEV